MTRLLLTLLTTVASTGVPVDVQGLKGGQVHGTVTLLARSGGTAATVDIRQLKPHARVRILVHAGDCLHRSASFAALPTLTADARGRVAGSGFFRFHGAKVPLRTLTAEPHSISVVAGTAVACGEIR